MPSISSLVVSGFVALTLLPGLFAQQTPARGAPRDGYDRDLQTVVGAYRLPSGDPVVIRLAHGGGLVARDLETGLVVVLDRREAGWFLSGDSVSARFVPDVGGGARELHWRRSSGGQMVARRIPLTFHALRFASGEASLEGTLVLPEGAGPHPAVVVQPGSSWILRESAESLETAITFAAYGIAGFAYDKRGHGASTGEILVAFDVTADDAAAAAAALVNRFDVNPDWIGIWGLSQGGWIAPLAAMRTGAIRYLVLVGAPGTSPARQEIQRARAKAEAEGLSSADIEAVGRFQELSFRYGRTGLGWEEYAAARQAAEGRPWLRWVWSPKDPGFDNFGWGRLNGYHNPLPTLLALQEPVLALWGEHDVNVDPEVQRSIFEVALDAADNPDYTLSVVPDADHVLRTATSRASADALDRIAPDVWSTVTRWVLDRTRGPGRSSITSWEGTDLSGHRSALDPVRVHSDLDDMALPD
ncbi:MAG TPA: alpha/beta fold hydrolase [Gemmatimonadota bacterium]|nr:alpha/beta fold hydrolase [Gemmatimonadota bacterium]